MCGFFASNNPKVSENHLELIKSRVNFRGPDGESSLIEHAGWKLYHARLAIIAPNPKYNQPYLDKNGSMLVFNGEILNFKALAKKYNILENDSDTHVLSLLLNINDFDLNELEGFFAFVRIDSDGNLTHCARDRFGVKPLNYHCKDNKFYTISSEASVISDIFSLPYNPESIEEYKVFRAPIFQGSFFKEINVVEPGSCLISGKYFDSLSYVTSDFFTINDLISETEEAIRESIKSRMISDVPVGLLYSGGIDSNLINDICEDELVKFTGGFEGDYDVIHAQKKRGYSNIINISNKDFIDRFNEMIKLRKEPLSVPNEVILSFLAGKWSQSGGKVLLSGEAADELFAGYDRIYSWAFQIKEFNIKQFLEHYAYSKIDDISLDIFDKTNEFFEKFEGLTPFEITRQFFIKIHLPVLFRRLDFSLMYSGVEGREPLASTMMFNIAMKANPEFLFKKNVGKYPLREIISKTQGKDFAFAKKVGFPVDLSCIFSYPNSDTRFTNYDIWRKENLRRINL
tara:strand:- start:15293 stop:16834 length:1542 start_codon:yes stop_codon:yes gene_type:complete